MDGKVGTTDSRRPSRPRASLRDSAVCSAGQESCGDLASGLWRGRGGDLNGDGEIEGSVMSSGIDVEGMPFVPQVVG